MAKIAHAQAAAGDALIARAIFARALADAGLSIKDTPAPNPDLAHVPGVWRNMPASARMNLAEVQATATLGGKRQLPWSFCSLAFSLL
jgi:hypothetical protein